MEERNYTETMVGSDPQRSHVAYWNVPRDLSAVLLAPNGRAFETATDPNNNLYVIDQDGERTYIIFS